MKKNLSLALMLCTLALSSITDISGCCAPTNFCNKVVSGAVGITSVTVTGTTINYGLTTLAGSGFTIQNIQPAIIQQVDSTTFWDCAVVFDVVFNSPCSGNRPSVLATLERSSSKTLTSPLPIFVVSNFFIIMNVTPTGFQVYNWSSINNLLPGNLMTDVVNFYAQVISPTPLGLTAIDFLARCEC